MLESRRTLITINIFLVALALVILIPLGLMLLNSLKSNFAIETSPLSLPSALHWSNFTKAWIGGKFGPAMFTSLKISLLTVLFTCSTVSMTAYALARRKIRAWPFISGYFLAATTVPITLLIFPLYGLLARLGLLGNVFILALVYTALYTPFSLFLLRSYFLAIPQELEESARMDGANSWQVFTRVVAPLVLPGILTVALIVALFSWNEFLLALTFFQSREVKTAVVQFYSFQGRYYTQWNLMMASAVMLVTPIVLFFLILQRYFVEGLVGGGVKG